MRQRKPITIRKEQCYSHSSEDVWAAITDPRALAEWFEPNNHRPIVGHKFRFMVDPGAFGSAVKECEVLEADAPRRLVWSWSYVPKDPSQPRPCPMQVAWTLEPESQGTRLILEHSGAENLNWIHRTLMRIGWGFMMKKLIPRVLENIEAGKFTPGAIPLEKRYYTCKTVPAEFVR